MCLSIRECNFQTGEVNSDDQFMLVSKEERDVFGHTHQVVRLVLNDMHPRTLKEHQIALKFYILLVSEEHSKSPHFQLPSRQHAV